MFLLDTNVVSELRRRDRADMRVGVWSDSVRPEAQFISAITLQEIEIGALSIERRDRAQGELLRRWIDQAVLPSFGNRILPVDTDVALRCARLHVPDPRPQVNALIAATALVHDLTLVTRNVADFAALGVPVLNPWE
jgi:predicted nucleic acid-binding protein